MKHATATLSGGPLDQAVAMALGWKFKFYRTIEGYPDPSKPCHIYAVDRPDQSTLCCAGLVDGDWGGGVPKYSTDWAHGGPLLDAWISEIEQLDRHEWEARAVNPVEIERTGWAYGSTALEAVCRAIVASKLGDEVDL